MSVRLDQEALLLQVQSVSGVSRVRLDQLAMLLLVPSSLNAAQVQIIGGPFQDALGNALSNGYLLMQLQHDAVALNTGQIVGNVAVRIPLDNAGRIQGTVTGAPVLIWPNASLLPNNTQYKIWAYDANNRLVWDNPQVQTVGNTNPFNVNTWVPGP